MKLSEIVNVKELVERKVKSLVTFRGVPVGTVGTIQRQTESISGREEILVEWDIGNGHKVSDWFSRDSYHDEFKFLELMP